MITRTIRWVDDAGKPHTYTAKIGVALHPVVAAAMAQVAADKAVAAYEEAAQKAARQPGNQALQRAMDVAFAVSIRACEQAQIARGVKS